MSKKEYKISDIFDKSYKVIDGNKIKDVSIQDIAKQAATSFGVTLQQWNNMDEYEGTQAIKGIIDGLVLAPVEKSSHKGRLRSDRRKTSTEVEQNEESSGEESSGEESSGEESKPSRKSSKK